MTRRFAFTLAEVLITLGIIGVVAAMTIPTLISNTNGAQFKSAYKKALSTLNQAVLMNVAMEDTDFSTLVSDVADTGDAPTANSLGALLQERLQSATEATSTYFAANTNGFKEGTGQTATTPKLTYSANCTGDDKNTPPTVQGATVGNCQGGKAKVTIPMTAPTATNSKVFNLADGTTFIYMSGATGAHACTEEDAVANLCYGFIDVNGETGPNTVISCDEGTNTGTGDDFVACDVSSSNVKDIYPVVFYGQTVEPASDAARAVLFGK